MASCVKNSQTKNYDDMIFVQVRIENVQDVFFWDTV